MKSERIVALVIGITSICFGVMLLPFADALRRRMLTSRTPPPIVEVTVSRGIPRTWRNHQLPWSFIALGGVLVLMALVEV